MTSGRGSILKGPNRHAEVGPLSNGPPPKFVSSLTSG